MGGRTPVFAAEIECDATVKVDEFTTDEDVAYLRKMFPSGFHPSDRGRTSAVGGTDFVHHCDCILHGGRGL